MAEYFGVDNTTNRVVSGVWASDSPLPEGQRLEQITDGAQWGWEHDGTNWVVPTVSVDELRDKRDELLRSSDFTQLPDSPHKTLDKVKWATYRQQLRDLPEGYTPVADPVYPVRP